MSQAGKGHADYYAPGDWNVACAECGRKFKASEMRKLPAGMPGGTMWVCPQHWDMRQPQDFVRGIPDIQAPPFVQDQSDSFVTVCSSPSGVADIAVADCAIADNDFIPVDGPF